MRNVSINIQRKRATLPQQWRPLVKTAVRKREQARWWREAQGRPILRTYVRLKEPGKLHLESYLTVSHGGWNDCVRLGRCALTRLRCGTNELRIHTGRFDGTPEGNRVCWICDTQSVEDERHFLLVCAEYQDRRGALWDSLNRLVNGARPIGTMAPAATIFDAHRLSADDQFTLLTGGGHPNIVDASVARRVLSRIMIEIGVESIARAIHRPEPLCPRAA
jgi:hypothetical protein